MTDFSEIWIEHFNSPSSYGRNLRHAITIQRAITKVLKRDGRRGATELFQRVTRENYETEYVSPGNCFSRMCRRHDRSKTQHLCSSDTRERNFYSDLSCQIGYYFANKLYHQHFSALDDILMFMYRVFLALIAHEKFIQASEFYKATSTLYTAMIKFQSEDDDRSFQLPSADKFARITRIREAFDEEFVNNRVEQQADQQKDEIARQHLILQEPVGHTAPAAGGSTSKTLIGPVFTI